MLCMSHSTAAAADIALCVYIPLRMDTNLFGQVTIFQSNTNFQREYFMLPPWGVKGYTSCRRESKDWDSDKIAVIRVINLDGLFHSVPPGREIYAVI